MKIIDKKIFVKRSSPFYQWSLVLPVFDSQTEDHRASKGWSDGIDDNERSTPLGKEGFDP